jgi:hypothetical protein
MRNLFVVVSTVCLSVLSFSQASPTPSNDANSVVVQAIAAFSSRDLQSIHLDGTANAFAGSDQPSGSFSYIGMATGESTLQLEIGDLSRTETAGPFGGRDCKWVDDEGVSHDVTPHNCTLPVTSVLPLLGVGRQLASLTKSAVNGVDEHGLAKTTVTLQKPWPDDSPQVRDLLLKLSKVEIELDPQTHLVASLKYNTHPDRDANVDIPIEIRYSDYRQVDGVSLPFRIQKFLNNGLALDLTVSNATVQ